MVGVENSLESIDDLGELVCDVIDLVKAGGVGLGTFSKLLELLGDVKDLASEAGAVLPELQDVDAAEAGKLASASYVVVKKVLAKLAL